MPEAHFYLLPEVSLDKKYRTLCRLIAKVYQHRHTLYVHCTNLEEAQCLDSLLWTFQDISFIPHKIVDSLQATYNAQIPVILGYESFYSASQEILINLTQEIPEFSTKFDRVIEVVLPEEADKQVARHKYKQYKIKQFSLQTYTLTP